MDNTEKIKLGLFNFMVGLYVGFCLWTSPDLLELALFFAISFFVYMITIGLYVFLSEHIEWK